MSAATCRIAVIGGEGIGPEVTREAERVLEWFRSAFKLDVETYQVPFGLQPYEETGDILPEASERLLDSADAILWGAIGGPEDSRIPNEQRLSRGLLHLRKKYDLYANIRPVRAYEALVDFTPYKAESIRGVDLTIVRELTSGIYFGEPRGIKERGDGSQVGFNTENADTASTRRIAEVAFGIARDGHRDVCSVDKANVLESGAVWRREVNRLHDESFQSVPLQHLYIDTASMQLVLHPQQFGVILANNLFGDILSDTAATIAGSIGLLPSASFGEADARGHRKALYEPVHGSAPDIAGRKIANPIGAILSVGMLLRYTLGLPDLSELLRKSVDAVLSAGVRTADVCPPGMQAVTTSQMGDAIIEKLSRIAG